MIYFAMPVAGTAHGLRRFGLWLALLQQRLDRSCRATCAFLPMARKSFRYASATARNLLILSTRGISSMLTPMKLKFQCPSCGNDLKQTIGQLKAEYRGMIVAPP
jgi:hypothetical protein